MYAHNSTTALIANDKYGFNFHEPWKKIEESVEMNEEKNKVYRYFARHHRRLDFVRAWKEISVSFGFEGQAIRLGKLPLKEQIHANKKHDSWFE